MWVYDGRTAKVYPKLRQMDIHLPQPYYTSKDMTIWCAVYKGSYIAVVTDGYGYRICAEFKKKESFFKWLKKEYPNLK